MKISIITASYNYENYIKETIESVLNQTYSDWELIIVDDGSRDGSIDVIKSYCEKDSRIKLYTHENNENKGLKESLKLGISRATSDWIAFLESDDIFEPINLAEKVEVVKKYPDIKFVYNDVEMFGDEKRILGLGDTFKVVRTRLNRKPFPRNLAKDFMSLNLVFTFSSIMVSKAELMDCDFNTPIDAYLDYWLWAQLAIKNDFYYIDKKLTRWRMHKKSYISNLVIPNKRKVKTNFYSKLMQILKNDEFKLNWLLRTIMFIQADYNREKAFRGLIKKLLVWECLLYR